MRYVPGLLLLAGGGVGLWFWPGWIALFAVAAGAGVLLTVLADARWRIGGTTIPFDCKDVKIAHISDLHFPTSSPEAADALRASLVVQKPHFLVVTGDLQNHPVLGARAVREWIRETAKECQITDENRVIVLPGNHDLFVTGLFGIGPLAEWRFRRTHGSPRTGVYYIPTANVVFLYLDLNPLFALASAEGVVYEHRLQALEQAMEDHPARTGIRTATRILLVHQHPFPVPYGGKDFLLATKETHRLLRFVAQQQIHVILHGHKHYATWSDARVGGAGDYARFVQILGAGSAMKSHDFDPRGHNYNLLTINDHGVRRIRQFFKPESERVFVEKAPSTAERMLQNLINTAFGPKYRVDEIEWNVTIRGDGSATNLYTRRRVAVENQEHALMPIPGQKLVGGHVTDYVIADGPADWTLTKTSADDDPDYLVSCPGAAGKEEHSVTLMAYEFGSYALDGMSALNLNLPLVQGTQDHEDYLEYTLRDAVKTLRLELQFPEGFEIREPALRAEEVMGGARNRLPGGRALPATAVVGRTLTATLAEPEPNLTYRLSWRVSAVALTSRDDVAQARRRVFVENLFAARVGARTELNQLLGVIAQTVFQTLQETLAVEALPKLRFDISVMIPSQKLPGEGERQELEILAGFQVKNPAFRLRIGRGNAGVAFLGGATRCFDVQGAVRDLATDTYLKDEKGDRHTFLASYPLMDPQTKAPLAVVSVGALDAESGRILLGLKERACQEKILTALHRDVLTRLFKLAKMKER